MATSASQSMKARLKFIKNFNYMSQDVKETGHTAREESDFDDGLDFYQISFDEVDGKRHDCFADSCM